LLSRRLLLEPQAWAKSRPQRRRASTRR
jgi:hypothetical protein